QGQEVLPEERGLAYLYLGAGGQLDAVVDLECHTRVEPVEGDPGHVPDDDVVEADVVPRHDPRRVAHDGGIASAALGPHLRDDDAPGDKGDGHQDDADPLDNAH